jgi:putative transposase
VILCALGVDAAGNKHVLVIWEERHRERDLVQGDARRLDGPWTRRRPLDTVVIDSSKGLRSRFAASLAGSADSTVPDSQVSKNALGHLPNSKHASVGTAMRNAYRCKKVETAKRLRNSIARSLQNKYPRPPPRFVKVSMKR